MSKNQFRTTIRTELDKLNECIDEKIVHGRPYYREARRHRELLTRLRAADRQWPSLRRVGTFRPLALFLS